MTACVAGPTAGLVLPLLDPADSCFSESSCCPRGRGDFLHWGKHLPAVGPSWVNCWHTLLLILYISHHSVSYCLCTCQMKALWICREIIVSFSPCSPCHPAAVIVMITGQQHQSGHRASWGRRVRMRAGLPRPPAAHREWIRTLTFSSTGMMLIVTFIGKYQYMNVKILLYKKKTLVLSAKYSKRIKN